MRTCDRFASDRPVGHICLWGGQTGKGPFQDAHEDDWAAAEYSVYAGQQLLGRTMQEAVDGGQHLCVSLWHRKWVYFEMRLRTSLAI